MIGGGYGAAVGAGNEDVCAESSVDCSQMRSWFPFREVGWGASGVSGLREGAVFISGYLLD